MLLAKCVRTAPIAVVSETLNSKGRLLWHWVNTIFNRVDEDRRTQFGPDRVCAEWILRNGGKVKFVGIRESLSDYNLLPPEGTLLHLEEVDGTGSSIMDVGFPHFIGCHHIHKVVLHDCGYLQDSALPLLKPLTPTLQLLQVSRCPNITEAGLQHLAGLTNLSELILFDLVYVKDTQSVMTTLKKALPECNITYK